MNAIQLLTVGQTSPQRGQPGTTASDADAAGGGETGIFASLLTRTLTEVSSFAGENSMKPLTSDGLSADGEAVRFSHLSGQDG